MHEEPKTGKIGRIVGYIVLTIIMMGFCLGPFILVFVYYLDR